jgi:hypothetical protein
MSKVDEFRAKAAECEKRAEEAKDSDARRFLAEAAESWREMAAQAEKSRKPRNHDGSS